MPRVLSSPPVSAVGRPLDARGARPPAWVREVVDRERAEAYEQGRADGRAEIAATRLADAEALVAMLRTSVAQEAARVAELRSMHDARLLALAARIARYVVDEIDTSSVEAVVDRVRAALDEIDDTDVVVHVAAGQVDDVTAALAGLDVDVVAADDVAPGDALLAGRWSAADLSRTQRWDAVMELLDGA